MESKITGRRPTRSETTPSTGMKKNCMSAKTVPKIPSQAAAREALPPRKLRIKVGSTGTMIPSAIISRETVMRMKTSAAVRVFMNAVNFHRAPVYAKYGTRACLRQRRQGEAASRFRSGGSRA